MTAESSDPGGLSRPPAAVLGLPADVFPALRDAEITERILACAARRGMSAPDARRFSLQATDLVRGFQFECCSLCEKDLDGHELTADMFGNAHAVCLDAGDHL